MYITSIPLSHNFLKAIVSGLELRARGRTDHVSEQRTEPQVRYTDDMTRWVGYEKQDGPWISENGESVIEINSRHVVAICLQWRIDRTMFSDATRLHV